MSLTRYIDNRLKLHADVGRDGNSTDLEKKQFAYQVFREDSERNRKRQERKESEIKDIWRDIYQLIGFDNVFQGVWFQGVTQLAANQGCRSSAIPITLSVFVSVATILGVYLKISNLRKLENSLHLVRLYSKALQSYISECEREGEKFDFDAIGAAAARSNLLLGIEFGKASVVTKQWNTSFTMKTEIINRLDEYIILREGNAYVSHLLTEIRPDSRFVLNIDLNGTYREYFADIESGEPEVLFFSSDECIQYKRLRVDYKVMVDLHGLELGSDWVSKPGSLYGYVRVARSVKDEFQVPWWRHAWNCLRSLMRDSVQNE